MGGKEEMLKIIAEIGVNYTQSCDVFNILNQLPELGIKYAKMQMFTKNMVSKELEGCVLDWQMAKIFYEHAKKLGIELFFSVMYPEIIKDLEIIGVNYYKLRFADQSNLSLYRKLKKINKPVFVSTLNPEKTLWKNMSLYHKSKVNFLICIPQYPASWKDYTKFIYDCPYIDSFSGISDHTKSTEFLESMLETDFKWCEWFELHVALDENAYEIKWSKTIKELKEVLNK